MFPKRLLALILFAALAVMPPCVLRAQWVQTSLGDSYYTSALTVIGSNLFAGTDSGVFLSTNEGECWNAVNFGLRDSNVWSLYANAMNLFVGTYTDGIYLSTNNGTNWVPKNNGIPVNSSAITLVSKGTGLYAGLSSFGVYLSSDSGTSWTLRGLGNYSIDAFGVKGSYLFAGTYGAIFLSSDSAESWKEPDSGLVFGFDQGVSAFAVIDSNLFVGDNPGRVYLSTDNGSSWNPVDSGLTAGSINSLFVTNSNLFAGTDAGIFLSTNNGAFWSEADTGFTFDVNFNGILAFAECGGYLFASDDNGVWRRPLSDFGISSVGQTPAAAQSEIHIYPNPFSQSTQITFTSQTAGYAEVTIVNMLGVEVARLFSGELVAGEHSFNWDAGKDACTTGVYECLVRMNGQIQTLPVVLMR